MSADKDLVSVQQARDLVEAAFKAQGEVARFDQAKIDRICEAMAKAALREAARLGAMAVEETGYGVPMTSRRRTVSQPKMSGTTSAACVLSALYPSRKMWWRSPARAE